MPLSNQPKRRLKPPPHYQFPYVGFHGKHYPLIPLTIKKGPRFVNTFALVDSGASVSVFRPEIAQALQIGGHHPYVMKLDTANGGVTIGLSKLEMTIEKTRFRAMIGFSETYTPSFNILGREDFFNHFNICFHENMKTLTLVPLKG